MNRRTFIKALSAVPVFAAGLAGVKVIANTNAMPEHDDVMVNSDHGDIYNWSYAEGVITERFPKWVADIKSVRFEKFLAQNPEFVEMCNSPNIEVTTKVLTEFYKFNRTLAKERMRHLLK